MKIIAMGQCYNEGLCIYKGLQWLYPLVDQIVLSEGRLTPFGNLPIRSTDDTIEKIKYFITMHDVYNKIKFFNAVEGECGNREKAEGNNKNFLLSQMNIEDGDIIYIWDSDEFFLPNAFLKHIDIMEQNPTYDHIRSEEWQFAYGMKWAFKASHGRFIRYRSGCKFTTTNNFNYLDGKNATKHPDMVIPRDKAGFFHLCWTKDPQHIREKVLSFNRPSFTSWYNNVYLVWPKYPQMAYINNKLIHPYFGTGFAEGQHEKLVEFEGEMPEVLKDINVDWTDYINEHCDELKI